jgi:hypothetical protein
LAISTRTRGAYSASSRRQAPQGGQTWTAPLELLSAQRGQLPGFADVPSADLLPQKARPDRDFRALWLHVVRRARRPTAPGVRC